MTNAPQTKEKERYEKRLGESEKVFMRSRKDMEDRLDVFVLILVFLGAIICAVTLHLLLF